MLHEVWCINLSITFSYCFLFCSSECGLLFSNCCIWSSASYVVTNFSGFMQLANAMLAILIYFFFSFLFFHDRDFFASFFLFDGEGGFKNWLISDTYQLLGILMQYQYTYRIPSSILLADMANTSNWCRWYPPILLKQICTIFRVDLI